MSAKAEKKARSVEAKKAKLADELTAALDEMMETGKVVRQAQEANEAAGNKVGRIKRQIEALKGESKSA